ncbi:MAG: hypothetical protein AB4352_08970 [Hormoscilla sp.]
MSNMLNQNTIDEFGEDEQSIVAFVHLYQTQPELFSDYQSSLAELCDNLPDDIEAISEKILEWCEDDAPKVYPELVKLLSETIRGPGGRKNLNVEQAKDLVNNGIRKSIPDRGVVKNS